MGNDRNDLLCCICFSKIYRRNTEYKTTSAHEYLFLLFYILIFKFIKSWQCLWLSVVSVGPRTMAWHRCQGRRQGPASEAGHWHRLGPSECQSQLETREKCPSERRGERGERGALLGVKRWDTETEDSHVATQTHNLLQAQGPAWEVSPHCHCQSSLYFSYLSYYYQRII